ncbi:hypothetical protein H310_04518 [Aphanomyces invadans]|uniref:Uncharacterized protein n=1 Tax=Aphanomyces invadans TaxID=157072 RepID=A0A024UCL7_9STRA|nr:hypothetical protein H310_04518 [Aphanomyces invadans]ETW04166.1 hypothetical protein H310_04518 [Aphanomyces invadans]|eukprot:XP_008867122.1 hypothetical protein H310_04518 [Aphanomyces invadans]
MQIHLKDMPQQGKLKGVIATSSSTATLRVKVPPNGGRWSDHEHRLFLQGIELYGKDWRRIARLVQTRTTVQTRSHAQKHFDRMEKERREDNLLMTERAAKAGLFPRKTDSLTAPKKRSHAIKKPSAVKQPSPSLELTNVTFPSAPQPPLAMTKTSFAPPPPRFLDDHMYRYLHGPPKPQLALGPRLGVPNMEEVGFAMASDGQVLDYISFDECDDDHFVEVDESARPDVEYLLDAMPGTDFYSILDVAKDAHQTNSSGDDGKSDGPARTHTPYDHLVLACEPSILPIRQQRGLSFPRSVRPESPKSSPKLSSVMNSIYV